MSGASPAASAYRPCAAIVLFARDGRVLVGERIDLPAAWQLPQGGIDAQEAPGEAALRELIEEIGTGEAEILAEGGEWHSYDLPPGLAGNPWKGRFRGQRVRLVALRFTGEDRDIDVATAQPEFRAWKWVALEELPALAVAFKRPLYEAAVAEFRPLRDQLVAAQGH